MKRLIALVAIGLMLGACSIDMAISDNAAPTTTAAGSDDSEVKAKSVVASIASPALAETEKITPNSSWNSGPKEASSADATTAQIGQKANGPYWIQLAAATSLRKADEEAARLQEMWPEIFETRKLVIIEKNSVGRGTYFRVQTGGFDTFHEAQSICAVMHAEKQGCFALKRS